MEKFWVKGKQLFWIIVIIKDKKPLEQEQSLSC
jgi:hypothetical protein